MLFWGGLLWVILGGMVVINVGCMYGLCYLQEYILLDVSLVT